MARNWTTAQQYAISARDGTLLVSAAAGSGKTAVLVQRVIERLIDPEHPCDADRLLVVTFTNAAAAEMRERIAAAIEELLAGDPGNTRLQRQQILLARANISTIHSFCSELVRENFYKLNISPDFRISDSNEMLLLRDEAMQKVMEELYEEQNAGFVELSELFSAGRDDARLLDVVNLLYDFVRSHPFPARWLAEKAAMYRQDCPVGETEWGRTVLDFAADAVQYGISLTQNALNLMEEDSKLNDVYRTAFSSDLAALLALLKEVETGRWDAVCLRVKQFTFEKLKPLRGYKEDPLKLKVCGNRDEVKKTLDRLQKLFFSDERQCREDIARMAPLVEQLFRAVSLFGEELDRRKAERRIADFGDLEHWALRLLVRSTPAGWERTETALELSSRFDEVMVDEYQDTNEAQDMIFRAVSRDEDNLFMVGDVKQSIYRFRQAMPEIFLRRKQAYPPYDPKANLYPARVALDRNFRSRRGVTDAVNFIFHQIMSQAMGEMEYNSEEELVAGAAYPGKDTPDTVLHILDLSKSESGEMDIEEARHISETIVHMMESGYTVTENGKERPVTFHDFCILLRNANTHACVYAKELQQRGIPAWSDTAGSFFGTPEVGVMLSLLRVIDNPVQDIPLLSVLMSPIYGFTPDDVSDIRLCQPNGPLYFALRKRAEVNADCARFLQEMEGYRRLGATMSADRLIRAVYDTSGYLAMVQAMPEGQLRLANLRLLLEYARTYEASGYKGLSGFIRFIDRLQRQHSDLSPAATLSETANVVRVMSIHRSKGLEFPICIVAGCSRPFNKEKSEVLLHPALGLGIKLKDEKQLRRYTTMPREAVALALERGGMSEELRVLYVAMTRAKERLILLSSLKNPTRTLGRLAAQLTETPSISPYIVRGANNFSDWILSCALRHPSGANLRELAGAPAGILLPNGEPWEIELVYPQPEAPAETGRIEEEKAPVDEEFLQELNKRLSYQYPAQALRRVPAKVAASELAARDSGPEYAATSRPAFLSQQGMTPAERGTALHAFLQFADYKEAAKDPKVELERLVAKGFLMEEQGKAVDQRRLRAFLHSSLMSRMLSSQQCFREYRFTVQIPANEIDPDLPPTLAQEPVVLQGAVDCAFVEEGALVIVDYKTDRIHSADELRKRYARQLELYAQALTRCTGMPVKECVLYSFHINAEVIVSKQ